MGDQTTAISMLRIAAPDYSNSPTSANAAGNSPAGVETGREERSAGARATETSKNAQTQPASQKDAVRLIQDTESGRAYVQILDRKTGDVLYQIPPEEIQKLAALLQQFTGTVIDTVV